MKLVLPMLLLVAAALPGAGRAQSSERSPTRRVASTVAYFSGLQEAGAFTPDEMAQRRSGGGLDGDAQAADGALNEWKTCVLDALARWAALHPGPGTLVDGAYGRCTDVARRYRDALLKLTVDGRPIVDMQLAKSLVRSLEDSWRPRLIAAALDRELASRESAPAPVPAPAPAAGPAS